LIEVNRARRAPANNLTEGMQGTIPTIPSLQTKARRNILPSPYFSL
jgi:hypothetical protein